MRALWTLVALSLWLMPMAFAQEKSGGIYQSEADQLLTIKKISVLPFSDNLQGIYSRPLENHFIESLNKFHRWDYVPANTVGPILTPEELNENSQKASNLFSGMDADGFFAGRVTKGPSGVSINLSFYLKRDGKLLAEAQVKDLQRGDLSEAKQQLSELFSQIVKKIPYSGRVMSRQGNRVTLNLGQRDGVEKDQVLSVIQILNLSRHPKFNFIVSAEKEILGRVKILKVDETLCFGAIVAEKEKGAIQRDAKIAPLDFVTYPDAGLLEGNSEEARLAGQLDNQVSFGNAPTAWVPQKEPTYGQISALVGLDMFNGSTRLTSYGGLETDSMFNPAIALTGELWLTSSFTLRAILRQAIISVDNPRAGAQPSDLSLNLSYYEMTFGYNFRFGSSVWDPQAEAFIGLMHYRLYADDSLPEAFTTMEYGGTKFGLRGQLPVSSDKIWYGGGHLAMVWKPSLHESPVTSGATSENTINQFGVFGGKKLGERLKGQVSLDFELYSSNFSGLGTRTDSARTASQRHMTLGAAVYYMF